MLNKTINGYTIKRKLGEGGMAEVWYAENKIGKKAAVKTLKPKLCIDEGIVERFENEAKVMVQLEHPFIRQVYDYEQIEGRPCIIMEYLEGEDLKSMLRKEHHFTENALKQWWNQLVDALNYTHQQGVIHRDIKPSNIFIDKLGNVKLLDFGIAKVRDSVSGTQTGQKLGTLVYMSPEQIVDAKHVDKRTDLYSLAVTFVHLLSGRIPYDTDSSSDFAIMEQIVREPLDLTGVPAEWKEFLLPYLEKKPENRPELREFDGKAVIMSGGDGDDTFVESLISLKPKVGTVPTKEVGTERDDFSKDVSKVLIVVVVVATVLGLLILLGL